MYRYQFDSNKANYSIPNAYRPISLLNCLGKLSETMIATGLTYRVGKYHHLHTSQIDGRPKRSAVDACMLVATTMDHTKIKNPTVSLLYMVVKGTFDNVFCRPQLNTRIKKDLRPQFSSEVETFLSNRTVTMSFDGQTLEMSTVLTTIPQGSSVSPILYFLYLSPLFYILE